MVNSWLLCTRQCTSIFSLFHSAGDWVLRIRKSNTEWDWFFNSLFVNCRLPLCAWISQIKFVGKISPWVRMRVPMCIKTVQVKFVKPFITYNNFVVYHILFMRVFCVIRPFYVFHVSNVMRARELLSDSLLCLLTSCVN